MKIIKESEMVKNLHGVSIKKCCASCKHEAIGKSENQRICMNGEGEVPKNYLCSDWEMSPKCKSYKMESLGRIKKPHYIAWLKEHVSEINERDLTEQEASNILSRRNLPSVSTNIIERAKMALINDLPRFYEKTEGSRYV